MVITNKCVDCSLCSNVCSKEAIEKLEDTRGFIYYKINKNKCVNCRVCYNCCPQNNNVLNTLDASQFEYFALFAKDNKVLKESQSGGAFFVFGKKVINSGGVVYGAVALKPDNVCYCRASNLNELELMQKSKYFPSHTPKNLFKNIIDDLENESIQKILVCMTPCQLAGLVSFIKYKKISDEKLITMDIICHGVPSPLVWKAQIELINKKYKKEVSSCIFRDKQFGWHSHVSTFFDAKGEKICSSNNFSILFSQGYVLRESCYSCKYTNIARNSDFTIGDYWNYINDTRFKNPNDGLSEVICRTEKAKSLFNDCLSDINYFRINKELSLQWNLQKPSVKNIKYEKFWSLFFRNGVKTYKKFTEPFSRRIKILFKKILHKKIY